MDKTILELTFDQGREAGIKEVVEWVEANLQYPTRGEGLVLKRNMDWTDKLKEQVAEIMNDIPCRKYNFCCPFWDIQGQYCFANNVTKNNQFDCPMTDKILNLIKVEVDKLTVIDPYDCINFNDVAIQQLQHTKKQLLEAMK